MDERAGARAEGGVPGFAALGRRAVLRQAGGALAALVRPPARAAAAPALVHRRRPGAPLGVQAGEVGPGGAVVWSASDRPARLVVEYATTERFAGRRRVVGSVARPETGWTARAALADLPPGQQILYRAQFVDPSDPRAAGEPVEGRFRTPPRTAEDVSFVWSADTAGQGWGINLDWDGMRLYAVMAAVEPDFFVHCGDLVYADDPLVAEVPLPGGGVWRNVVTEAKAKVAETLEEFRGNHRYNLLDRHVRAFNARVPVYVQWDDHDVRDNWYPGRVLTDDPRYRERRVDVLAARARRAMAEFTPLGGGPLHRVVHRGPLLDVFLLDLRSHRGPNGDGRAPALTDAARILGAAQLAWLEQALRRSQATWKVIVASQPIGLIVWDDFRHRRGIDGIAQGDGPPLGRELEIARLLAAIRRHAIRNVVWITADVHYCATHEYHPERARFTDFEPFHEFVSGPIHAGSFGPNALDDTFGPRILFARPATRPNGPPSEGQLYFGHVRIDGRTGVLTVTHRDVTGAALHVTELAPARRAGA